MTRRRKLGLLALTTVAASWLAADSQTLRTAAVACAALAASSLLHVYRSPTLTSADSSNTDDDPAEPTARLPWPPAKRSSRRQAALHTQLTEISNRLDSYQETLIDLAQTVRRLESDRTDQATRLERRLQQYENDRAVLEHGRQQHIQQLQGAMAHHKQALATLQQTANTSLHEYTATP